MPVKVYVTKKARFDHGPCDACGEEIKKGQTFKFIKLRNLPPQKRHFECKDFELKGGTY
jgi:hypothetical protein